MNAIVNFFVSDRKSSYTQQGQVLLIVVLVMVVSLSIGLSVVSRSIINQRITKEQDSSQRAFSAAEAGVEQALKGNTISSPQNLGDAKIEKVKIQTVGNATSFLLNNKNPLLKDDGADIWLSQYPGYTSPQFSGTLTIYWGQAGEVCDPDPNVNTMAALEVVVLTGTKAVPVARHYAYDSCANRKSDNNFTDTVLSGGTVPGTGAVFAHTAQIAVSNGLLARVVPLYAGTPIGVSGGGTTLPPQGNVIESVGSSGGTQRKIAVYQGYPKIPTEFFPYVLLSP